MCHMILFVSVMTFPLILYTKLALMILMLLVLYVLKIIKFVMSLIMNVLFQLPLMLHVLSAMTPM